MMMMMMAQNENVNEMSRAEVEESGHECISAAAASIGLVPAQH